jgi:cellulose synthase/poly-beta-1,6-N-acetylglucosamine synthase-like glycosyltransferase
MKKRGLVFNRRYGKGGPRRRGVAVVMAAKDERETVGKTLDSLVRVFDPRDIYVVSDGSSDGTEVVARKYEANVIVNKRNIGKALSLRRGVEEGRLIKRYWAVMFIDADTEIDKDFLRVVEPYLRDKTVGVVVGQVKTKPVDNLYVSYRDFSYTVWQQLWKRISSRVNGVPIAPGTASIYKTRALKRLEFDRNLIIEDFDLTYQVHRKKLGRIVYLSEAVVYTQDPNNTRDYFRQMRRWNLGMWQSMLKHRVGVKMQAFELVVWGLLSQTLVHAVVLLLVPLYLLMKLVSTKGVLIIPWSVDRYFVRFIIVDLLIVAVSVLVVMVMKRRWNWWKWLPLFWLVEFVNVGAMIASWYLLIRAPRTSVWKSPRRWGG